MASKGFRDTYRQRYRRKLLVPRAIHYTAGSFPDIKKKIQSLAVEISSPEDLDMVLVDIKRSSPSNLREIILVVGQTHRLLSSSMQKKSDAIKNLTIE